MRQLGRFLGSANVLIALLLSMQMLVKRGKEEPCEHYLSPGSSNCLKAAAQFISLLITFSTHILFLFPFLSFLNYFELRFMSLETRILVYMMVIINK